MRLPPRKPNGLVSGTFSNTRVGKGNALYGTQQLLMNRTSNRLAGAGPEGEVSQAPGLRQQPQPVS